MDKYNKNNNPYPFGQRDYFGLNNIDEFLLDNEETFDFSGSFNQEEETEISFENPASEPVSKTPKSFSLGPINTSGNAPAGTPSDSGSSFAPDSQKKKFVVTFDDNEDIVPQADGDSKKPRSRGGIYFANEKAGSSGNKQQKASASKSAAHPAKHAANTANAKKKAAPGKKKKKPVSEKSFAMRFISTVLAFTLFLSFLGASCLNDILAISRNDDSVVVTIPNDCTADDIIDILADNNLIHQKWFCKFFFNLKNKLFNDDPSELVFLSGVYYVKKNLGFEAYLTEFQQIQETEKTVQVFFPEGWTAYQMFDKLENFGICSKEELVAALEGTDYEFDFISGIEDSSDRVFKLEGYLFPDTYEFYEKCDANTIIRKMLNNFSSKWTEEYQARADELGMTMDEVIILASIIQREAGNAEQMPVVSSVLHNRLNNSVSYPTLGCDSTLNYIETYVKPNVTSIQAQAFADSYDTSKIRGLPAGPVCNPGIDAIEAALYPEDTDYFYFCHDNSGEIYLARTNAEHDQNLLEVLRKNDE